MDYKKAGVDIEAGYKSVELMKEHVKKTMRPEVLGGLGGFSGAFSLEKIKEMEEPVLLSGTDGCGTKVKLAMILDKHDTIGIDAVAMCVNDIACAGGEPLFFLDYIACGKNEPEKIATIVSGVAEGCLQSEAALIGGETAEHPGLMPEEDYDLAGFAVGVCDKKDMITGQDLKAGDVLIGMASSGVHSNGFSLVRKVFEMSEESLNTYHDRLGRTLGEALLVPTKIYVKALKSIKEAGVRVKACSHITGGGFYENIPRMLKEGTHAVVKKDSYPILPIFPMLAEYGDIAEEMMYNTFNMGLGMIVAVDEKDVESTLSAIKAAGEEGYVVGHIEAGNFMLKVVVLVSGGGTNLQAIIDAINTKTITNTEIIGVISNNKNAYALERAKQHNIFAKCISPKDYETREAFNDAFLEELNGLNPDLIVLAGFLVVIPKEMIKQYENRIINIHPSLIPAFCGKGYYGLKVHEKALERGVKVVGATVHFVDEGTDTGPIILQKAVSVQQGDTPEILQRRVMEEAEWKILPEAIHLIANGKIKVENRQVRIES